LFFNGLARRRWKFVKIIQPQLQFYKTKKLYFFSSAQIFYVRRIKKKSFRTGQKNHGLASSNDYKKKKKKKKKKIRRIIRKRRGGEKKRKKKKKKKKKKKRRRRRRRQRRGGQTKRKKTYITCQKPLSL